MTLLDFLLFLPIQSIMSLAESAPPPPYSCPFHPPVYPVFISYEQILTGQPDFIPSPSNSPPYGQNDPNEFKSRSIQKFARPHLLHVQH